MPDTVFRVIRIVSAVPLDDEKGHAIAARFAKQQGITDYEVRLEVDSSLIGGIVIYTGGYRYDFSIKGQLGRIVSQMKNQKALSGEEEALEQFRESLKDSLSDALNLFAEQPVAPGGQDAFLETEPTLLGPEDTSSHLVVDEHRETLEGLRAGAAIDEIGHVLQVGDGVAYVDGIQHCQNNELIQFSGKSFGIAMNLEEHRVGIVLLKQDDPVHEGMMCRRTGRTVSVPTGKALLGRVVDPLGDPVDGFGSLGTTVMRPVESPAPSIIDRQPVRVSLHTGITAIDALTPIGRGQRELIIGDRQTGKTAIAIDTILNQKNKQVYCVYVAIGQKMSTIASVVNTLRAKGAMEYTTVVAASASAPEALQYLAPYAGCAMAEELMYQEHADVLIIYDDLTKHAQAYRAISLLLRRPPGREAFPGDVFYLHSRLLERAARLSDLHGGGSITALPIVETQSGDISAYIPTNVISITDGQIYLESELFFSGQRPAINVGLSVSRVGGAAQIRAMRKVAGPLRIGLAQYRELEAFAQFGSELDPDTRRQLKTGERLIEVLKQSQYEPVAVEAQVIMLYTANRDFLCELDREDIKPFLEGFVQYLRQMHPELMDEIRSSGEFTDQTMENINTSIGEFRQTWQPDTEIDDED